MCPFKKRIAKVVQKSFYQNPALKLQTSEIQKSIQKKETRSRSLVIEKIQFDNIFNKLFFEKKNPISEQITNFLIEYRLSQFPILALLYASQRSTLA